MSRQRLIEVDTDLSAAQLDALASGNVVAAEHRHAAGAWIDLNNPATGWTFGINEEYPQYRVTADGVVKLRGKVNRAAAVSVIETIFQFPLDGDNTHAPLIEFHTITDSTNQAGDIPQSGSIEIVSGGVSQSTLVRFKPLQANVLKVVGDIFLDGLSWPMVTPCATKIFCIGDSFVSGAFAAITGESGLSTIGKRHNVAGFGNQPPVLAGRTTSQVLTFLTQYVDQIAQMPGPVMVYMTIGTVDQGFSVPLAQIAGQVDAIVSTILESRPDIFVVHAGYNFESSFPSDFMPFVNSSVRYPTRYEFIDMYPFDAQISQVGGGDDHPDDAGHAKRLELVYENLTVLVGQTQALSCP